MWCGMPTTINIHHGEMDERVEIVSNGEYACHASGIADLSTVIFFINSNIVFAFTLSMSWVSLRPHL